MVAIVRAPNYNLEGNTASLTLDGMGSSHSQLRTLHYILYLVSPIIFVILKLIVHRHSMSSTLIVNLTLFLISCLEFNASWVYMLQLMSPTKWIFHSTFNHP